MGISMAETRGKRGMQEIGARWVHPELKELVVEASRSLARLDADRLEELALSCQALNRDIAPAGTKQRAELARQAREAAGDMATFRQGAGGDAGQPERDEPPAGRYARGGWSTARSDGRGRRQSMGTISSAFSLISQGLDADQAALSVVANNVANANTPGYTEENPELAGKPAHQYQRRLLWGRSYGDGRHIRARQRAR